MKISNQPSLKQEYLPNLNRVNEFIKGSALTAKRHLDRELVWVKYGNIWVALQDCLSDPRIKRDVSFYDEDLFLVHLVESDDNPNDDCNIPYRSRWGTYDLYKYSIQKAISEFCNI